jgi:LuxR family maltose regulon positive regulatory protein
MGMPTALLATKLYMPPSRPELVPRPRLIEQLNQGVQRRLTLISAPAGFGKTTLVSAWIKETGIPAAWLSLDAEDNDPARFLAYLVAALQSVEDGLGAGLTDSLLSAAPPTREEVLTTLINQVDALTRGLLLVFDDYHLITAEAVHEGVAFLLEHLPPQVRLVIATRADPPLPIARLRGRGQLTELRQTDLRFSPEEAAAFLKQVTTLDLTTEDVAALTARTEGWISGLQMAALALQSAVSTEAQDSPQISSLVQAFTGSDRHVLDYLVEEVLQRQPEHIQTFLLQTSILNRLTGRLCDAILDEPEQRAEPVSKEATDPLLYMQSPSQRVLHQLEAANLFIIPLDNERRWYRYHRLFADLLHKRLQQFQPERIPILHERASAWFEENDLPSEAIRHALSAGDLDRAADLIEQAAEATLNRVELTTFLKWIDALPDDLVLARPSLALYHAWALMWSGQPLDMIESRLHDLDKDSTTPPHKVATLRSFIATWQGQLARASDMAEEALERLPEDESFLRTLATWNLGMAHLMRGDLETGAQILENLARIGQRAGNAMAAVSALSHLAEIEMSQAHLFRAREIYEQALTLAQDRHGRRLPIAGMPLIGLGELHREWNDFEAAERYLKEGIELVQRWGAFAALDGYIALARLRQAQNNAQGANAALNTAQQIAVQFDLTELDDLLVALHQVRLWIAQGELPAAIHWLQERGFLLDQAQEATLDPLREQRASFPDLSCLEGEVFPYLQLQRYECILAARVLLKQSRPGQALALLDLQAELITEQGRRTSRRMIEVQNLRALVFFAQGEIAPALDALRRALFIAEPGGYVRMFLDEGEPMVQLLRHAASSGISPEYASKLIAAGEDEAQDRAAKSPHPRVHTMATQPLIEPLSERELDVLRLLATGMSNPEIGEELFIATSTVRSHLKNVYGKLNVHKRWDAVHRAEELGLL